MEWTQVFVVIGVFFAGFVWMMSRMDSKIGVLESKIDHKFDNLHSKIRSLDSKISNIEGQITQMTRSNCMKSINRARVGLF